MEILYEEESAANHFRRDTTSIKGIPYQYKYLYLLKVTLSFAR